MANEESIGLVLDNKRTTNYWYQDLDNHLLAFRNSWFLNPFKVQLNASYQKNLRRLYTDEPDHATVDMALTTVSYEGKGNVVTSEVSEFAFALQGMNQSNRNRQGEVRVLPDYSFNDLAVFGLVQHDFGNNIHLQVGLRFDNRFLVVPTQEKASHSHEAPAPEEEPEILEGFRRYFGNVSGSLGATFEIGSGLLLRSNIASAYRAPNMAELTQDGEHGIRYEIGDPDLGSQRNYEIDISVHYHQELVLVDLAGYYNHINDYIFLSPTADTTDEGLTIFRYLQNNANLYGFEGIVEILPVQSLSLKLAYNFNRGMQPGGANLPLMPQNRLRSELKYTFHQFIRKGQLFIKLGTEYAFAQNHPSDFETSTNAYFLTHAGVGLELPVSDHTFRFSIQFRNLFNTAYTDHLSLLKEIGFYNMGRNVVIGVSIPFHIHKKTPEE